MTAILSKIFLGPMLKFWIGGVLIASAYVGVKAGLSWFESRVVEYEQTQLENAALRASQAFLEARREKERAATAELEKRLETAQRSFDEYRNETPDDETKNWRNNKLPPALIERLHQLSENPD